MNELRARLQRLNGKHHEQHTKEEKGWHTVSSRRIYDGDAQAGLLILSFHERCLELAATK